MKAKKNKCIQNRKTKLNPDGKLDLNWTQKGKDIENKERIVEDQKMVQDIKHLVTEIQKEVTGKEGEIGAENKETKYRRFLK